MQPQRTLCDFDIPLVSYAAAGSQYHDILYLPTPTVNL
jgi:hypothetical protein